MHSLILASFMLAIGFAILAYSALLALEGSVEIALYFNIPKIVIGLTFLAWGTSLPELFVSVGSAFQGNTGISLGSLIGSNIINISLIMGVPSLFWVVWVKRKDVQIEIFVLLVLTLLLNPLVLNGYLSRDEGIVLLIAGMISIYGLIFFRLKEQPGLFEKDLEKDIPEKVISLKKAIIQCVFGLILLIISSEIIINSSEFIANYFNIDQMVIGLTIVAFGTGLPEFATAIAAAYKKEYQFLVSNLVGSNLFNLFIILPLSVIVHPMKFNTTGLMKDFTVMYIITILLYIFIVYGQKRQNRFSRVGALILICIYAIYVIDLFVPLHIYMGQYFRPVLIK